MAVIGAGLAGLSAARHLAAHDVDVRVLEARTRVGGRLLNFPLDGGQAVELGGEWMGPGQERLAELARSVGVGTFRTHSAGSDRLELEGRVSDYSGSTPKLGWRGLLDAFQLERRIQRLSDKVPVDEPWKSPGARRLDTQTLGGWLRTAALTNAAGQVMESVARTLWGGDTGEVSLLHALFYLRANGGLRACVGVEGGAQQDRFHGGSQLIAERLGAELGERLLLGTPVRKVELQGERVRILAGGVELDARRLVVAMSPPMTGRIRFEPPLPVWRDQLAQHMSNGAITKAMAFYDEPFWREQGWSGRAISDRGPARVVFDNSPPDNSYGVLVGFIGGPDARELADVDDDTRRQAVVEGLARVFGPSAGRPVSFVAQDWTEDPWTRGGPHAAFSPGGWTAYGQHLRRPIGAVHWAGTET
ncbi:MAG TPA: FAD-dependent oxidoreductase, partial [Solirubrobacteraceae bacterium]|nr:FAD-dependent oxidoreductase [Solirubrobacteraceae bacterium]